MPDPAPHLTVCTDPTAPPGELLPALARLLRHLRDNDRTAQQRRLLECGEPNHKKERPR
jgi:hypothetical protein